MKRAQELQHQLESLEVLGEAVNAMKSLSAHHLRAARTALTAARLYREGIDGLMASAGVSQIRPLVEESALLLIAADLGLCKGHNAQLTMKAIDEYGRMAEHVMYCVGRRPLVAFRRAGIALNRNYAAVTNGLTRLLPALADDVRLPARHVQHALPRIREVRRRRRVHAAVDASTAGCVRARGPTDGCFAVCEQRPSDASCSARVPVLDALRALIGRAGIATRHASWRRSRPGNGSTTA